MAIQGQPGLASHPTILWMANFLFNWFKQHSVEKLKALFPKAVGLSVLNLAKVKLQE